MDQTNTERVLTFYMNLGPPPPSDSPLLAALIFAVLRPSERRCPPIFRENRGQWFMGVANLLTGRTIDEMQISGIQSF